MCPRHPRRGSSSSSSFYLPNNTTVCTFARIRFRRAGQQGLIRTLTAALNRRCRLMPVRGCEGRRVMAEESSAVWGVAVWGLGRRRHRRSFHRRLIGQPPKAASSAKVTRSSRRRRPPPIHKRPASANAAAAAAFYYAVYYSARLRTPAVCLRGQCCRPSIRRELSYHGLYLSASTQPIMTR